MKVLRRTQFGSSILRQKAHRLSEEEILTDNIQDLIKNMRHTLLIRNYGIGIAAPQVGVNIALSVIELRTTSTRPNLPKSQWKSMVIINPEIVKKYGKPKQKWEGCLSLDNVFAKAERYETVRLKFTDEKGTINEKDFDGLLSHVLQHETDHLNGILFVDRVKDTTTYVSESEYKKLIKSGKA
jgi:peptide deformylase